MGVCQQLTLAKELAVSTKASLMLDYYGLEVTEKEILDSGRTFMSPGTRELYLQLTDLLKQISSSTDPNRSLTFVNDEFDAILPIPGAGTVTSLLPLQIGIWSRLCGTPASKILLKSCTIGPLNYTSTEFSAGATLLNPGFNVLGSELYNPVISEGFRNPIVFFQKLSVSVATDNLPGSFEETTGRVLKGGSNICEAYDCLISHLSFLADYTNAE
jgi:hypothetical protein